MCVCVCACVCVVCRFVGTLVNFVRLTVFCHGKLVSWNTTQLTLVRKLPLQTNMYICTHTYCNQPKSGPAQPVRLVRLWPDQYSEVTLNK